MFFSPLVAGPFSIMDGAAGLIGASPFAGASPTVSFSSFAGFDGCSFTSGTSVSTDAVSFSGVSFPVSGADGDFELATDTSETLVSTDAVSFSGVSFSVSDAIGEFEFATATSETLVSVSTDDISLSGVSFLVSDEVGDFEPAADTSGTPVSTDAVSFSGVSFPVSDAVGEFELATAGSDANGAASSVLVTVVEELTDSAGKLRHMYQCGIVRICLGHVQIVFHKTEILNEERRSLTFVPFALAFVTVCSSIYPRARERHFPRKRRFRGSLLFCYSSFFSPCWLLFGGRLYLAPSTVLQGSRVKTGAAARL